MYLIILNNKLINKYVNNFGVICVSYNHICRSERSIHHTCCHAVKDHGLLYSIPMRVLNVLRKSHGLHSSILRVSHHLNIAMRKSKRVQRPAGHIENESIRHQYYGCYKGLDVSFINFSVRLIVDSI